MAGKSGGAWKVAYADFVTAMMAFFLVMWIMSQDKKLKRAVAHYFSDPAGFTITGNSTSPTSSGALFQSDVQGNVPELDNQSMGRGSAAYAEHGQLDRKSQMVSDWLRNDQPSYRYWREQAAQQRRLAAQSPLVRDKIWTVDEAASVQLAEQMKAELVESAPRHNSQFYDEVLDASLSDINWRGLAEEYLTE